MPGRPALWRLLHRRDPALLLAGQTVSMFGDGVASVALTLLVLDTTRSPGALGWFAAARMAPTVAFLLVGGVIVDRHSRRLLLLVSDVGRAIVTTALVALIASHHLHYVDLIAFALVFGSFDALFTPALTAVVPEIVPDELLPAMNSARPLANNVVGQFLGPAVGGLLAASSTSVAIGVDAATFAVSATSLLIMRPTPRPERREAPSMRHEILEGLRFVRGQTWIWATLLSAALLNALVFVPSGVLLSFLLRNDLHASKPAIGFFFAIGGAAGALVALVVSNLPVPRRRIRAMSLAWVSASLAVAIVGVAHNYAEILVIPILTTPGLLYGNVIWESMLQRLVPRELLGRVSSVDWFVSLGLSPVGLVVAGSLSGVVGVRPYLVGAALLTLVPSVLILASRRVNAIDQPSSEG